MKCIIDLSDIYVDFEGSLGSIFANRKSVAYAMTYIMHPLHLNYKNIY